MSGVSFTFTCNAEAPITQGKTQGRTGPGNDLLHLNGGEGCKSTERCWSYRATNPVDPQLVFGWKGLLKSRLSTASGGSVMCFTFDL